MVSENGCQSSPMLRLKLGNLPLPLQTVLAQGLSPRWKIASGSRCAEVPNRSSHRRMYSRHLACSVPWSRYQKLLKPNPGRGGRTCTPRASANEVQHAPGHIKLYCHQQDLNQQASSVSQGMRKLEDLHSTIRNRCINVSCGMLDQQ